MSVVFLMFSLLSHGETCVKSNSQELEGSGVSLRFREVNEQNIDVLLQLPDGQSEKFDNLVTFNYREGSSNNLRLRLQGDVPLGLNLELYEFSTTKSMLKHIELQVALSLSGVRKVICINLVNPE